MPLEKASKQILLYGGLSGDTAEHLVEPPAVAYVENMHWRNKEGVLQKRLGLRESTAVGKPSSNTTPAVLHGIGDKLYTFLDGKEFNYDIASDEWNSSDQVPVFTETSKVTSSQQSNVSGHAYYYCKDQLNSDDNGYAVFAVGITTVSTLITTLAPDGTVVSSERVTGGTPQIMPHHAGPRVYTASGNDFFRYQVTVQTGAVVVEALAADLYSGMAEDFTGGSNTYVTDIETGFGQFQVMAPYDDVQYHRGERQVFAYTNTSGVCEVFMEEYTGAVLDSSNSFTFTTSRDATYCLGICDRTGTDRFYIQTNDHGWTAPAASVNGLAIWDFDYGAANEAANNASTSSWSGLPGSTRLPVSGSLQFNQDTTEVYSALYYTEEFSFKEELAFAVFNSALTGSPVEHSLEGQRPTSPLVYLNPTGSAGKMYMGMQFSSFPYVTLANDLADNPDSFLGYLVPTTNTIVDVTTPTASLVAAAVDGSQSKHSDYTNLRNNVHLGSLAFDDDGNIIWTTREIVSPEGVYSSYVSAIYFEKDTDGQAKVNVYKVSFSSTTSQPGIPLGDGVVLPGGVTMWFDGDVLSELSPLTAPQIQGITDGGPTGNLPFSYETKASWETIGGTPAVPANWRRVQVVCGYTDVSGNIHRSAPSAPVFVYGFVPNSRTLNAWEQGRDIQVTVAVPLTMNIEGNASRYFIETYISDDANGNPRLASRLPYRPDGSNLNIDLSNSAFTGAGNDAATTKAKVRSTEFIYTTGGVLASDAWPTISRGIATSQRLFALSAEDAGQVYYSKRFQELTSPEFSAPLVLSLGDERKLTAIGRLDDKVVVFEKDDIHVIYGPGPDNAGRSGRDGGFEVHQVTTDVGTNQPNSLVEVPQGLIFKSDRGFYLLDRGLKVHFIGGPVYDMAYNATVKSTIIIPEWAEVRFLMEDRAIGTFINDIGVTALYTRPARPRYARELPSDACLVYNYEYNRWTVFSGYTGSVAARTAGGRFAMLDTGWDVQYESRPEEYYYLDPTGDYTMQFETPWIPVSERIQGFARLRKATVLGKYLSSFVDPGDGSVAAGDLQVTIMNDFEEEDVVTELWRANVELIDYPTAVPNRLQVNVRPPRQKCQSVKFKFEDVRSTPYFLGLPDTAVADPPLYTRGQGFELTGIDLDIGVKEGPVRSLGAKRKA